MCMYSILSRKVNIYFIHMYVYRRANKDGYLIVFQRFVPPSKGEVIQLDAELIASLSLSVNQSRKRQLAAKIVVLLERIE